MLNKLKKTKSEKPGQGFTIIEVMIVLAIAGLILLIVFLAVPALQRSARNTQRKNDAAGALAAVGDFVSDNGGSMPTFVSWTTPSTLTVCNTSGCPAGAADAEEQAKLGYYTNVATVPTKGDVTLETNTNGTVAGLGTPADELIIEEEATCSSATSVAAGSSRSYAAVYGIESGGAYQWQCTGS